VRRPNGFLDVTKLRVFTSPQYPVNFTDSGKYPVMHGGVPVGDIATNHLWHEYKNLGCQQARCEIIQRYVHLVSITAGRLFGPMPSGIERDDLVGAGVVGLVKAVDQFDPQRGIKFETYAITLIRGAILEMLRGDDWVPRLIRDQQKQLKQAYVALEAKLGRSATEEEIAEEMGITLPKLEKLLHQLGRSTLISLDDLRLGTDQQRVIDYLAADEPTPHESVALRERQRSLTGAIDKLPDRERTVVALYYHDGLTFKEIGQVLTVSESRAYQLHAQAVTRLRGYLEPEVELYP